MTMPFNPLLYNEKYRIPTNRLQDKNYGKGFYHIVLCTKEKRHNFGEIQNNEIHYSRIGEFTKKSIEGLNQYYPFATILAFQVMPNHVHLLISLSDDAPIASVGETARNAKGETARNAVSTGRPMPRVSGETAKNAVSTGRPMPRVSGETAKNAVSTGRHQSGLAIVIAGLKRTVTFWAKNNNIDFAWQARYYDTIIRNANHYNETNYYIHNNVLNWNDDELNVNT